MTAFVAMTKINSVGPRAAVMSPTLPHSAPRAPYAR
jgi:hypothetical protein